MSQITLKATRRTWTGKEKAKKLRRQGSFPAIVYGPGYDSVAVELPIRETENALTKMHGEKVLVSLDLGDSSEQVFIRSVQRDPVKNQLLHADFYRVDMAKELDTKVPINGIGGTPAGVKMGGLLEQIIRILDIRCLPGNVPPHIDVDVSGLQIGQSVHVRDLPAMDGVKVLTPADAVIFLVAGRVEEEAESGDSEEAPAE